MIVVRILYSLMVLVAAAEAIYLAAPYVDGRVGAREFARDSHWHIATLVFLLGLAIPSASAIFRVTRRRALLERPRNGEFRVYLWAVTSLATLGHVLMTLAVWAILDKMWNKPTADIGPAGGAIILATVLYLLALWIGEFVLVRDDA